MKIFGIEFIPLNVPFRRRLQMLAVAVAIYPVILLGFFSIPVTIYLLIYGSMWIRIFIVFYLVYMYYDRDVHERGGRWPWYGKTDFFWRYVCDYFPMKLIKTVDIDPSKNYLFCAFPHGILGYGSIYTLASNGAGSAELFPGLEFRPLILDAQFRIPILRDYMLSAGCCGSGAKSISHLLSTKPSDPSATGHGVILLVGGAADAFKCLPGNYRITLKKRRGFIKLALQHGSPLVPVFSFGEHDYYDQVTIPIVKKIQYAIKNLTGVAPVIFNGRGIFQYSFGVLPRRAPVNVVVGAPIEVPKVENPTDAQINEYHEKFTEKLLELFETHKKNYVKDYENISLIIDD